MATETDPPAPRAPAGLRARGAAFWRATVADYDLTRAELELLREAARTLDVIDALAAVVATEGSTSTGSTGQTVVHPAIAEARQQRGALERLLKALALPADDADAQDATGSVTSLKASRAAETRWRMARAGKGA